MLSRGTRRMENGQGMSDISQGPGWWLASDGKWYPPELWTGPPNTNPGGGPGAGASQPWTSGPATAGPGSTYPAGQPVQPGQPGPGGASPYPGSTPPTQPGYGYGYPPSGQPASVVPGGGSTNGLAIVSLVCAIAGIFFITSVVAIVLGFAARSQIRKSGGQQKGDGLAIAGIVIGFVWLAFYVLIFIIGALSNNSTSSVISLAGTIGHIA